MAFGLDFILFVLGSILVAVCIVAVDGPGGERPAGAAPGHGGDAAHGHGSH